MRLILDLRQIFDFNLKPNSIRYFKLSVFHQFVLFRKIFVALINKQNKRKQDSTRLILKIENHDGAEIERDTEC